LAYIHLTSSADLSNPQCEPLAPGETPPAEWELMLGMGEWAQAVVLEDHRKLEYYNITPMNKLKLLQRQPDGDSDGDPDTLPEDSQTF
jgi:hypothetical protein